MTFGLEKNPEINRGEQRKTLLQERDDSIAQMMRDGTPVAVIARIASIEADYCRKAVRRLASERGIAYTPTTTAPTTTNLTDASKLFRSRLADILYDYRNAPGRHQLEVARDTGLTQAQQLLASQRGGSHDFQLSQLERLAKATGQDFKAMMLKALLTPEEYKCLKR